MTKRRSDEVDETTESGRNKATRTCGGRVFDGDNGHENSDNDHEIANNTSNVETNADTDASPQAPKQTDANQTLLTHSQGLDVKEDKKKEAGRNTASEEWPLTFDTGDEGQVTGDTHLSYPRAPPPSPTKPRHPRVPQASSQTNSNQAQSQGSDDEKDREAEADHNSGGEEWPSTFDTDDEGHIIGDMHCPYTDVPPPSPARPKSPSVDEQAGDSSSEKSEDGHGRDADPQPDNEGNEHHDHEQHEAKENLRHEEAEGDSDDESDGGSDDSNSTIIMHWGSDETYVEPDGYGYESEESVEGGDPVVFFESDDEYDSEDEDEEDARSEWSAVSSGSDRSEEHGSSSELEYEEENPGVAEAGPAVFFVAGSGANAATSNTSRASSPALPEAEILAHRVQELREELQVADQDDEDSGEEEGQEVVAGGRPCHPWAKVQMNRRAE